MRLRRLHQGLVQLLGLKLIGLELVLGELHIRHVLLWILHLILLELVLHHLLVLVVAQVVVIHAHVAVAHLRLLASQVLLHVHENLGGIGALDIAELTHLVQRINVGPRHTRAVVGTTKVVLDIHTWIHLLMHRLHLVNI